MAVSLLLQQHRIATNTDLPESGNTDLEFTESGNTEFIFFKSNDLNFLNG